jgi:hypothetical protein
LSIPRQPGCDILIPLRKIDTISVKKEFYRVLNNILFFLIKNLGLTHKGAILECECIPSPEDILSKSDLIHPELLLGSKKA